MKRKNEGVDEKWRNLKALRLYTHTHTRHSTKKNGKYQLAKRELQVKEIGEKGITLVALAVTVTVMLILGMIN